ncbi:hypothetical protein MN1_760 [Thermus phage MN1]|nr:hypothetical protein MN1_760 [Thermus phage MN1]
MDPKRLLKPIIEHRQGKAIPSHRWVAPEGPPPPGSPPASSIGGDEHRDPIREMMKDPRVQRAAKVALLAGAVLYTLHPNKIRGRVQAARERLEEAIRKWEKRGKDPKRLRALAERLDRLEEAVDTYEAYWRLIYPAGLMPHKAGLMPKGGK